MRQNTVNSLNYEVALQKDLSAPLFPINMLLYFHPLYTVLYLIWHLFTCLSLKGVMFEDHFFHSTFGRNSKTRNSVWHFKEASGAHSEIAVLA
jgi:hypothetical protein